MRCRSVSTARPWSTRNGAIISNVPATIVASVKIMRGSTAKENVLTSLLNGKGHAKKEEPHGHCVGGNDRGNLAFSLEKHGELRQRLFGKRRAHSGF